MTNDRRVPPSDELSADVLYASDFTCCVCHKPGRRVQLHHIDGDHSNTTFDNLAVLCLECHDETQISGGFGRKHSPEYITKCRGAWLDTVQRRRAAETGEVVVPVPRRTQLQMSRERARQDAQRLRPLYATFFHGVRLLRIVASQMCAIPLDETLDQRSARLTATHNAAVQKLGSVLPELQIEPGAAEVCQHYDFFRQLYDQVMSTAARARNHPHLLAEVSVRLSLVALDGQMREIRKALHKHLAQLDSRS